jgi:HEAT repeat protein
VTPPETPPDKGIKNPKPGTPTPPDTGGAVPTPPSGPKAPRKPPSSAPTPDGKGGGRRSRGPGLEHWTAWWYFSRDRWLVRQPAGVVSGDSSPGRTAGTSRTNVAAGDAEAPWRARARAALRLSLSSDDVEIFTGCAVALGKAGDVRDAHPLLTVLSRRYRNPQVRESLALGLGLLGPDARGARPALEFILLDKRDSSRLRGFAGISLGLSGDAAALPALLRIAATASDKRDAVAGAVLGLGLLGEPMVIPDLVDMLQDKSTRDSRARRPFAATALGHLGGDDAVKALLKAIGDRDKQVRRSAVLALGECAPAEHESTLKALTYLARDDRDRATRNFAMVTMGHVGGPTAVSMLARWFSTGDRDERAYAALGLGILGRDANEEARASIGRLLRPEFLRRADPDLRGALAVAMGLLGDPKGADPLRRILSEKGQPDLRAHCAVALGLLKDRLSAEVLRAAASDATRPNLQREAAIALGLLGDATAAPLLAGVMRDSGTEYVRAGAALALGRIGGPVAAEALQELLLDDDASGLSRGQAAVGLGLVLDPHVPPALSRVSRGLNYRMSVPVVIEVLTIP